MKNISIFILTMMMSSVAVAAVGTISGYVKNVTIKENGTILVGFEDEYSHDSGCAHKSAVAIKNDNAYKSEFLSVILTAHSTHKKMNFYMVECYAKWGTSYAVGLTTAILDQ